MKLQTFDHYLQDIHAQDYHGTDDDMPDDFDRWKSELDVEKLLEYMECFTNLNNQIRRKYIRERISLLAGDGDTPPDSCIARIDELELLKENLNIK